MASVNKYYLNDGTMIPLMGSNGVCICKDMVVDVYKRLAALEQEKGSLDALTILFNACFELKSLNLNTATYPIQDEKAKELLKKHNIMSASGDEIIPRLLIVSNCLARDNYTYAIRVVFPIFNEDVFPIVRERS